MKKTKIICTVGPSTDKPGVLEKMIGAGMDIARFNFSHGSHGDHKNRVDLVRQAASAAGRHIGLMADTKGPEMRLGVFARGKEELVQGKRFALTARDVSGDANAVSINYAGLPRLVTAGDVLLLSDGLISLKVDSVEGDTINTIVLNGGEISSRKRVAAPGVALDLPFLSGQDMDDILFAAQEGMDFVAASFVQRASDILAIRRLLEENGCQMGLIAKIENAEGVKNIEEIIKVSDGIMVARGDLGVEIPAEEVPLVQKSIISMCNENSTPVITATQMLESMINNPRPTRAEASDVANAIFDGSDVIMLSGETASGNYPVEAVETMSSLAKSTENALRYDELVAGRGHKLQNPTMTDAISHATVQVAHELRVAAIVASSETGYTAKMISRYRSRSRVIAVTPHEKSARRMQLYWGVEPLVGPASQTTDGMIGVTIESARSHGLVQDGDMVVITAGVPVGMAGSTNLINVIIVGNILMRGLGIGKKVVKGKACVVNSENDLSKFKPGDVLVVRELETPIVSCALKASAIIAEEGGLTSQAAIVSVSYGVPAIVGVADAALLKDGMNITVDAARGLIYYGNGNK
jgi:pyruvate kinase